MDHADWPFAQVLAWTGYGIWLLAGWFDFRCHRRTDLAHTSGVGESRWHLVQLGLCGSAVVATLAFHATAGLAAVLLPIVAAHAVAGYLDTRQAFRCQRTLRPGEQHLHSILDLAPWVGWGAVVALSWRTTPLDWAIHLRRPAFPLAVWTGALLPAVALCVVPALWELRGAMAAKADGTSRGTGGFEDRVVRGANRDGRVRDDADEATRRRRAAAGPRMR